MGLRPYQREAVDAATEWMQCSTSSFVIEAATGAGKSHMIAAIAEWVSGKTGKAVLCLAPSKELVIQNRKKFLATGKPASLLSASAGKKCLAHDVIFATPGTAKGVINKLAGRVACVLVDEAHRTAKTVIDIIEALRERVDFLRVGGFSATPYRTGTGFIYAVDVDGESVPDDQTINPYYHRLIYRITAGELLEQGYLTPPVMDTTGEQYDTSALVERKGRFTNASVDKAFVGHGRKTSRIVAQIIEAARNRMGVMIFAANIKHAEEVMASLPPELSACVTGNTKNRDDIIERFKQQEIKYLVNVDVLTTGFDAEHVDLIALLRKTESAVLLQQIIGRGTRLHPDKREFLVLDFAGNIESHCPDGDIFKPSITVRPKRVGTGIDVECPQCGYGNKFTVRGDNPEEMEITKNGYLCDLAGELLLTEDGQPYPAHYGRRCMGFVRVGKSHERCGFRWAHKVCPSCDAENDIAARRCKCGEELVNPNEKLREEFYRRKKNAREWQCDAVKDWNPRWYVTRKGDEALRVTWETEYRTFETFHVVGTGQWNLLCNGVFGRLPKNAEKFIDALMKGYGEMPRSVRYVKKGDFYIIGEVNGDVDEIPTVA